MAKLTENQRALLRFVRETGPGVTKGDINRALASEGGIYAYDGWKWGMRGLIDRGLIRQDAWGHYYATGEALDG